MPEVVRYTKAQRPTFLPIQPFVLQPPSGKQQSKALGSLLNQYISHKHGKPSTSRRSGRCKGLTSHFGPSPLGSYSSVYLEAATSSDTCSTCTPSPVQPHSRTHWAQPSPLLFQSHTETDQKQGSPKTLDTRLPEMSPIAVQTCLDQTDLNETSLIMEPLQKLHPDQAPSLVGLQTPKPGTQYANPSSSPAITSVTSLTSKLPRSPTYVVHASEGLNTMSGLSAPRKGPGMCYIFLV